MEVFYYMLLVFEVEEIEIFKICFEYWNYLVVEFYRESLFFIFVFLLLFGS